jgi:hypothetical protein
MRRAIVFVVAAALGLAVAAAFSMTPSASAQTATCPVNDGKWEGQNPPFSPAPGITVTSESENLVTFTVASGTTLVSVCVKSGNDLSGHSVSCSPDTTFPVDGPATCSVTTSGQGNGISHITFDVTTTPTPTPSPTPTPTPEPTPTPTPEPTPTPTPEPTPTPTPEPTPTPTPEPTPTPTPEPTPSPTPTPTPPPGGGGAGGAGGGGGGSAAPSGELPFTGLPVLVPLLAGLGLMTAGLGLWRRGREK